MADQQIALPAGAKLVDMPPMMALPQGARLVGARPEPDAFERAGTWIDAHLPGGEKTQEEKDQGVQTLGDFVSGNAKSVYEVSAPNVFHQIYKKHTGQPNDLENLPKKGAEFFALSLLGGTEDRPSNAPSPKVSEPAPRVRSVVAASEKPSLTNQLAKIIVEEGAKEIPIVGRALRLGATVRRIQGVLDKLGIGEQTPPPTAAPPAAPVGPQASGLPSARLANDRAMSATAPFRKGPGEVPQDIIGPVDTRTLPGGAGVRTTPIGLLPESGVSPPASSPPISVRAKLPSLKVMRTTKSGTRMVNNPELKRPGYDAWEDKAIEDAAREDLNKHGRIAFKQERDAFEAGSSAGNDKADLIALAKQGITLPKGAKLVSSVGSSAGAAADTAYFQAAQRALGAKASTSEVAQLAQKLKTSGIEPDADLEELLRKSLELARKK